MDSRIHGESLQIEVDPDQDGRRFYLAMSSTKNLTGDEAVAKLRHLTNGASTCLFYSGFDQIPAHACPMQVQQVDADGCLWFFSGADSTHNHQLAGDPRAQLSFCNPSNMEFLTIHGEARILHDPVKVEELWNALVGAWFPGGQQDPNLTLLRVRPIVAHYWDTENGKLLTLAKLLTAAMTDRAVEGGVHGDLEIPLVED